MYQVWCVSLNILESFLGDKSNSVNLLGPNHLLLWGAILCTTVGC